MSRILFINACVRTNSRTLILARQLLDQLNGSVSELNLYQENLSPLNGESLEERNQFVASKDFSSSRFQYAKEFADADEIVIAAPYWDLAFPSVLRVYFEHVTVTGLTFSYSPEGEAIGLCKAGRVIYVTTAGGPIQNLNLGYDYIKALSTSFYGIPEVLCFKAENLDIKGADVDGILQQTINEIRSSNISTGNL